MSTHRTDGISPSDETLALVLMLRRGYSPDSGAESEETELPSLDLLVLATGWGDSGHLQQKLLETHRWTALFRWSAYVRLRRAALRLSASTGPVPQATG